MVYGRALLFSGRVWWFLAGLGCLSLGLVVHGRVVVACGRVCGLWQGLVVYGRAWWFMAGLWWLTAGFGSLW